MKTCFRCDTDLSFSGVCPECRAPVVSNEGVLSLDERRCFTQSAWYHDCKLHYQWVLRYEDTVAAMEVRIAQLERFEPVKCECGTYFEDMGDSLYACPECY